MQGRAYLLHDTSLALGKGNVSTRLVGDELDLNLAALAAALLIVIIVVHGINTGHVRVILRIHLLTRLLTRSPGALGREWWKLPRSSQRVAFRRFMIRADKHISRARVVGHKVLEFVTSNDTGRPRAIGYFDP